MNNKVIETGLTVEPASQIELAFQEGNLDAVVNALSANPEAFNRFVKSTELALSESKDMASAVKDRNFIKRIFSSNTSDLAKVLLEQNDVLTRFFVLLQLLTLQTKGNSGILLKICDAIKTSSDVDGQEQGNLQKIAISFLEQNIEAIKAEEIRDKALMKLLKAAESSAAFENSIREAHSRVEKQYLDSSNKLQQAFDSYKKILDGDFESFKLKIEKDIDNQNSLIGTKATSEELKQSIDNLSHDIGKQISIQHDEVQAISLTGKKRDILLGAITLLALVLSIVGLFI